MSEENLIPGKGEAVIRFSPQGSPTIVARSPEAVAQAGISVYPPYLDTVFGEGAAQRYCAAKGIKNVQE